MTKLSDKQKELAKQLGYTGIFADRDSLQEAMSFAGSIIETFGAADKAAAYTALYVLHNTWVKLCITKQLP